MTAAFWTLFAIDVVAMGGLWIWAARAPRQPEGFVGGWLLLLPILLLIACAAVGATAKSNSVRVGAMCVLGFPWIIAVMVPAYRAWRNYRLERYLAGDDEFHGAQRELAHAIRAHDVRLVKTLIPKAGDLNGLLVFAIANATSMEIVRLLIDGGADPNRDQVLVSAINMRSPELVEVLLKAGAKPDRVDSSTGRPSWWEALSGESDAQIAMLQLVLDHGADVRLRNSEGGPVGFAARASNWRGVALLIERGAAWKDEQQFGTTVKQMLASEIAERQASGRAVPDVMRQLELKYK
ncbi:MAG TPA: ankyrin repeat domain-containing protein [Bryobacteraceae bacterium]